MGTINYNNNEYVSIGVRPDDLVYDAEFESGSSLYDIIFYATEAVLGRYDFRYFTVGVKYGHYEGFYINIESDVPEWFDSTLDKRECQKEITQVRKCLLDLVGVGLRAYHDWWVPTWYDEKETVELINEGVKKMRLEVSQTPCELSYRYGRRLHTISQVA